MENQKPKLLAIANWFLPSGAAMLIYIFVCGFTLTISNASFFRNLFILPDNFHFKNAVLDSVNNLVQRFIGDHIARSAVVAIFWAIVGLFVYMVIWVLINYSDELGNDLAVTGYVHPPNVSTKTPLIHFLARISFQIFALFVFVIYINLSIGVLVPRIGLLFQSSIQKWPSLQSLEHGLLGILAELAVLHLLVVLIRLLTLKKRVFG